MNFGNISGFPQEDSEVTGQGNSLEAEAIAIQRAMQLLRSITQMKDINKLQPPGHVMFQRNCHSSGHLGSG